MGEYIDRLAHVVLLPFSYKKPKFLGEVVDSRAEARNIQDKPGASCSASKER